MAKHRSPAYPACSLPAAIQRATQLQNIAGRHGVPMAAIAEAWNYKPSSSAVLQYVSALKQYGLLADQGNNEDRTAKLTEDGLDLLYAPKGSPAWRLGVREAALHPKLYAELWSEFDGTLPAANSTISHYLIRQRGFNPGVVSTLIRDFRETIDFAGLVQQDKSTAENGPGEEVDADEPSDAPDETRHSESKQKKRPPMDNSIQNVLGLAEGQVVLELPTNLSNRSTRLLKNWFRLILAAQSTDDLPEETDGDGD